MGNNYSLSKVVLKKGPLFEKKVGHKDESKNASPSPSSEKAKLFHDVTYRTVVRGINANVKYPLPLSKEEERTWIEDHHYFIRHMWQGNFSSPVDYPLKKGLLTKVLHIGSNSKNWLSEMRKDYPATEFSGINVDSSTLMNLLEDLKFSDNSFDMVFVRMYGNTFTEEDWDKIIGEVIRITKHNGWIELMPTDTRCFNCGPYFQKWNETVMSYLELKNINGSICENFHQFLMNTNQIKSVSHQIVIGPIGTWGGKAGELGVEYFKEISAKIKADIVKGLDMAEGEYNSMMTKAESEFNDHRTYSFSHRFVSQKL